MKRSIMHCQGNARRSEMQDSGTNALKGSIIVAGGEWEAVWQRLDWGESRRGQVISLAGA